MSNEPRTAYGVGLTTTHRATGVVLDAWFPAPVLGKASDSGNDLRSDLEALAGDDEDRGTSRTVVECKADLDAAPADALDVWLRLHLLSHRLVPPHGADLTGIFGLLTNVVWTDRGPCAEDVGPPGRLGCGVVGVDGQLVEPRPPVKGREDAELVALRVRADVPLDLVVGRPHDRRAERQHLVEVDPHVEMHPVLDRPRLGHLVEPGGALRLVAAQAADRGVAVVRLEVEHRRPEVRCDHEVSGVEAEVLPPCECHARGRYRALAG
jgi:hypothetical protein